MNQFSGLVYKRPNYELIKETLLQLKEKMLQARTYADIRSGWLEMKKIMYRLDSDETIAYIRFLCGIDAKANAIEAKIQAAEDPKMITIQNECNQILLDSEYVTEFQQEYGGQMVNIMRNWQIGSNAKTNELQAEEIELMDQYRHLIALHGRTPEMNDACYDILNRLVRVRTLWANRLGYDNYITLGYQKNLRTDYNENDLLRFRNEINEVFTPVCNEMHKGKEIQDVPVIFDSEAEFLAAIRGMFTDFSEEGDVYIRDILDHGYYDLSIRPNKDQGYFGCCMLAEMKMPFVIGNYSKSSYDSLSFIHELGHGYAFYTAARKQKLYDYHRSSSSINEIHSKSMEHFAYRYLDRFVGNRTKESIRYHLYRSFDNLLYRCAIDEFEHNIYYDITLSRRKRCSLWADISQKYMPWVEIDPNRVKNGTHWPNQSHLFTMPFYYIEYDIAQISAFEMYERSKLDFNAAWKDYDKLCRNGGSKSFMRLLEESHLSNPFTEGTVSRIGRSVLKDFHSAE